MAEADIRAMVVKILKRVDNIGVIHDYARYVKDWTKFLQLFQDRDGRINGAQVSHVRVPANKKEMPLVRREHNYKIRMFMGLQDALATGKLFSRQVEAVQDEFDDNWRDLLEVSGVELVGAVQVEVEEDRKFGVVLCHYAELTLVVTERKTYR